MFKQRWPPIHVMRLIQASMETRELLHVGRFAVLCVVLAVVSAGVWAQEPATSFDQLNLLIEKGDKITLVDPSGNKIAGRISRLAPDGLDLNVSGKARTFSENNIQQITRAKQDSPLNGFLIGAGIGFGATLPINLGIADSDEKGVAVVASALWGLIGGGIGALVDAFIHERQRSRSYSQAACAHSSRVTCSTPRWPWIKSSIASGDVSTTVSVIHLPSTHL